MSIILDLIVIAIIALVVFLSARRGFVRTIIELAGFIAAVFISFTINTPLANITYDKIIEPPIVSSVGQATDETALQAVEKTWNALPSIIKNNSEKIGISKDSFSKNIQDSFKNGVDTAAVTASQNAVKPVVTKLLASLYSVIILTVLMFVVRILARFINRLFSVSIVGKLNRILGGIAGFPKGIIIAALFCIAVSLIVSFTKDGLWIFTKTSIDGSVIFRFLAKIAPFKI